MHPSLANASSSKLQLLTERAGALRVFRYRNLAINHWQSDLTLQGTAELAALTRARVLEFPEGVGSIHWLDAGVSLPRAEVRASLSEILVQHPGHVRSVGAVIESEGFLASALRSAVTSIMVLAPKTIPVRVFGKLDDLAAWLPDVHQRTTGVAITRDELATALREAIGRPSL